MEVQKAVIVLEYAENGDLFEYISICKGFKPHICRSIFLEILRTMEYLKDKGVSHRDLKPENFLFDKDFSIRISDFGLSEMTEGRDKDFILKTRVGTEGFKAPEIDRGEYNGEKIDVFALGVLLFLMHVGSPPFLSTKGSDKIYKHITTKNYERFWTIHEKSKPKGFFSESFKQLLNSLLSSNPNERHSIESLKEQEWLCETPSSSEELAEELKKCYVKIIESSESKKKILSLTKNNKSIFVQQIEEKTKSENSHIEKIENETECSEYKEKNNVFE